MSGKREIDWREAARLATEDNLSNYKIAAKYGVHESTIRRGLASMNVQRHLVNTDLVERMKLELDKPIVLDPNVDYAITADWHIPLYDPEYANIFLEDARANGIRDLILAGDFFNFDALSAYEPKQESAGLEIELAEAEMVMRVLSESFDRIYFLWGNHDARLHKALGFSIQFREAMKQVFGSLGQEVMEKITFTNLDHIWIGDDWYICHPGNYTRTPLSTARTLATKYNASVITAHSHHCAVGYAIDGERVVAEIGGLFDRHKTAYLQRSTTFPTWAQGYCFLQGGKLRVHSPGWSLG
jgi:hypothetical protein